MDRGAQHVGLVLGGIGAAGEKEAAAVLRDPGVVARCEPRGADPLGEREQGAEPEAAVTADARVGRVAARIALDERVDDSLAKRLAQVEGDMREPERLAGLARCHDRGRRAADALGVLPGGVGPETQRHPDRLVASVARAE